MDNAIYNSIRKAFLSSYKTMRSKNVITALLILIGIFLAEPLYRDKLTFAITYPETGSISIEKVASVPVAKPVAATLPQKAHAPEPSTLFLMLSGLSGLIIRFARRNFQILKRVTDIVFSLVALLVFSPILFFVAILIKINSPGPIIYRQFRVGQNHKVFKIYKLRTMRFDAEKFSGAVWAQENDPRITPIGKFLRKAHIDEIPQFINVLNGQMSIVGPRPERPEMVRDLKEVIHDYEKRLLVKPGITGLAQVWHKYDETIEDVKKKIKYDILYIRRMCLLTDLRIIANTFTVVLTGKGAR